MLEALFPQQQTPQRRGRPRKNKEVGETQVPNKPHARLAAKNYLCRPFGWNLLKVQAEEVRVE
jgi:hypothetical protein